MKKIKIYSVGTYNYIKESGCAEVLIEYKENRKYLKINLNKTTSNRCIIQGLIAGIKLIKEPCEVTLVTSTHIGVSQYLSSGKGVNKDLIIELIKLLEEKNCQYIFDTWLGKGSVLSSKIRLSKFKIDSNTQTKDLVPAHFKIMEIKLQERIRIAKILLAESVDIKTISKCTGISEEEIIMISKCFFDFSS